MTDIDTPDIAVHPLHTALLTRLPARPAPAGRARLPHEVHEQRTTDALRMVVTVHHPVRRGDVIVCAACAGPATSQPPAGAGDQGVYPCLTIAGIAAAHDPAGPAGLIRPAGPDLPQVQGGLSLLQQQVFTAIAVGLGHDQQTLAVDAATTGLLAAITRTVTNLIHDQVVAQLAETLCDAGHDGCDDQAGCAGGGGAWFLQVAARLADPHGPLAAIAVERQHQQDKWGPQHHRDGTGRHGDRIEADLRRERCETAAAGGVLTWRHILDEELAEAYAETDPGRLAAELLQVAAVAANWVEDLRGRPAADRQVRP